MGDAVVAEAVLEYQIEDPEIECRSEWTRVLGRFKKEIGDAAYRNWLHPVGLLRVGDGEVVIAAPTRFLRDFVAAHYADRLLALWRVENREIRRLLVVVAVAPAANDALAGDEVASARCAETPNLLPPPPAGFARERTAAADSDDKVQPLGLEGRFTFDNFVVGKPNEFAHAAARHVAEACVSPLHTVPFNPLFLYGGVGLGKTHLMHAVAWHVRQYAPQRRVIYLSAERFMYQFVRALRFKSTMDFKEEFRSVDLLMVDDLQFIGGKESTQEEFFHTFNALVDQNRQIVISADKSPSDLELDERVRSRLGWGLVADLLPTTYELRLGILESKAEQNGVTVPRKVMEFLAHKITSNVRELEGALNRIAANMRLVGRPITLETAQEELRDLLRSHERRVTIDEIQRRVAEHYTIRMGEMTSDRRARAVARPRQVAMYLAKQLTTRSLPEIGRKFGGRDHTTVIHAIRKIEELKLTDPALAEDVELLRRMLAC
jgi:chromosomal replication initiator protein